ncbi:MAG: SRPBCC family protein [Pseudomonadota bacterium]
MFHREFHTATSATRSAIWALWTDVNNWTRWNAGVEQAHLTGRFVIGAEFSMTPTGQEAMTSRLIRVEEGVAFTDETVLGDICVTVEHRIEPLDGGKLRIVYSARVTGPGAEHVGAAVTEDFDDVLAALVTLAERNAELV